MPNRKSEDEIVTGSASAALPPAKLDTFQRLALKPPQPPDPNRQTMQDLLDEVSRRPKSQLRAPTFSRAMGPPDEPGAGSRRPIQSQPGESSAAESLKAERATSQKKDAELARLYAQVTQLREENEQLHREKSEAVRAKRADEDELIRIKKQLELHMLEIEFLDSKNPLSPPEIREMFHCWRSLTKDNKRDPVKELSKGMEQLCSDWFKAQGGEVSGKKLSRFVTALNSDGRKNGGAIARS